MFDLGKAAAQSYLMQKHALYGVPTEVRQQADTNWAAATTRKRNAMASQLPGAVVRKSPGAVAGVLGKWGKRALIGGGIAGLGVLGAGALMASNKPANTDQGLTY